jgi:predicted DNA-binding mobile mystery protein A
MKTNKKNLKNQRIILERKIKPWLKVRNDRIPPSGWLKAIRGALGINTRQLAARLGLEHASVLQFEKREAAGTVSFESIQKVAKAMRCRFIYAIVPEEPFTSLDAILDNQALQAARETVKKVDHTMRLEQQGVSPELSNDHAKEIAQQLKDSMDPILWGNQKEIVRRKKSK